MDLENATQLVTESLKSILDSKGEQLQSLSAETKLFGEGSVIDSLDLVNVVVEIEEKVLENTGKEISLVDEQSVLEGADSFTTIGTMANLVIERVGE